MRLVYQAGMLNRVVYVTPMIMQVKFWIVAATIGPIVSYKIHEWRPHYLFRETYK